MIAEVRQGKCQFRGSKTGLPGLPDSENDVGGGDDYPVVRRALDSDADDDGTPDT